IRTMGFWRLVLVSPQRFPDPQVEAMAAGADDVLQHLVTATSVPAAIADCTRVYGLSARRRGVSLPELDPRAAVAEIAPLLRAGREVALLFGNERSGLDNDELSVCHAMVRIPSVEDFSSLPCTGGATDGLGTAHGDAGRRRRITRFARGTRDRRPDGTL